MPRSIPFALLLVLGSAAIAHATPIFLPGISNDPNDPKYYKKILGYEQQRPADCIPTVGYLMALYSDIDGPTKGADKTKLLPSVTPTENIASIAQLMGREPGSGVTGVEARRGMESVYQGGLKPAPPAYPAGWAQLRQNGAFDTWKSGTDYNKKDVLVATAGDGTAHMYIALQDGKSGPTRPVWPAGHDATITDGTLSWKEIGPEPLSWGRNDINARINAGLPIMLGAGPLPNEPDDIGHVVYAFGFEQINAGQANEQYFVYILDPFASGSADQPATRPKLWTINPRDLEITAAVDVNDPTKVHTDREGKNYTGRTLELLLTGSSAVPQPSGISLVLSGAVMLLLLRLLSGRFPVRGHQPRPGKAQ